MKIREIASGLQFPEGPVAMDDGSVLLVEIERGTLSRVSPDGTVDVVVVGGNVLVDVVDVVVVGGSVEVEVDVVDVVVVLDGGEPPSQPMSR